MKGADVKLSVLTELATRSGLPLDWIVSGRPSTEEEVLARLHGAPGLAESHRGYRPPPGEFAYIPRLDVEASAGAGSLATEEDIGGMLAFRSEWLRRIGINPVTARALRARGDSMEPTIYDGDVLLTDTAVDHVIDNGIYVIVHAGLVLLKRVHPTRDGAVTLISDNPIYPREMVPAAEVADLHIAGRVMWFGRSI